MSTDHFSDSRQRYYKIVPPRQPHDINSLPNNVHIVSNNVETYSLNLKDIKIVKQNINFKNDEKETQIHHTYQMSKKNNWKDILQMWAINKNIIKQFNKRKAKVQSNYSRFTAQLCNQSFRLQNCHKHKRTLTEPSLQQKEQRDDDLLQSKYSEPVGKSTRKPVNNIEEPTLITQGTYRNYGYSDYRNYNNQNETKRTICYSNLGQKNMKNYKTEQKQKEKIGKESVTFLTIYDQKKYQKEANSLILKLNKSLRRQTKLRNKTVDHKNQH